MNRDEQFEKRLIRHPPRKLPSAWRDEILSTAKQAVCSRQSSAAAHSPWWRELFWPHPKAWAALGGAWVAILIVNSAAHEPSASNLAQNDSRPAPRLEDVLRQKRQIFAELAGLGDQPVVDRPKTIVPRPRSQWQGESASA